MRVLTHILCAYHLWPHPDKECSLRRCRVDRIQESMSSAELVLVFPLSGLLLLVRIQLFIMGYGWPLGLHGPGPKSLLPSSLHYWRPGFIPVKQGLRWC